MSDDGDEEIVADELLEPDDLKGSIPVTIEATVPHEIYELARRRRDRFGGEIEGYILDYLSIDFEITIEDETTGSETEHADDRDWLGEVHDLLLDATRAEEGDRRAAAERALEQIPQDHRVREFLEGALEREGEDNLLQHIQDAYVKIASEEHTRYSVTVDVHADVPTDTWERILARSRYYVEHGKDPVESFHECFLEYVNLDPTVVVEGEVKSIEDIESAIRGEERDDG